jgi:hypothetical protein
MKRSPLLKSCLVLALLLSFTPGMTIRAQLPLELSLSAYPGFTLVNFEEALDYSDDYMQDWNEFHLGVAARGFLFPAKPLHVGAEFAWNQLYYAYYRVPYGPSPVYREFYVSTISFSLLGRYASGGFFAVAGAGIHIFDDGVAPAVSLEAGYRINHKGKLGFPISLCINPVFGAGTPIGFSAGFGVSYSMGH